MAQLNLKQHCKDLVWWPRLDKDIEQLVQDCNPCLVTRITGPLGSLPWPTKPWDHIQLDICGELHDVPCHLHCLVIVYNLHSNWSEVALWALSHPVPSLICSLHRVALCQLGPAKELDNRQWPSTSVC